jgi:biotin-(acetyl-CoA carboxylase) ligase
MLALCSSEFLIDGINMTNEHKDIKEKIIKHLDGLNELERKEGSSDLVKSLAERYDVSENMVQKILAEWSAGESVASGR